MDIRLSPAFGAVRVARSAAVLWTGTLLTLILHLSLSGLYGYQRDELYFIACSRHLAWGYVDQPPLIAGIAAIATALFGDSVSGLRVLPAFAAAALVALTGHVARRTGGGPFAEALAMLGVALAPFDLAVGNLLTMNAFEPLFWLGLTLLVAAQIDEPRRGRWVAIGIVTGLGILDKWSMALYAVVLFAGVALSTARRTVLVPGAAVAAAVAAVIAAPNIAWQAAHGWPQLQVLHNAAQVKNEHVAIPMFLLEQLPLMNPCCAILWLAGLVALARSRRHAGIAFAYGLLVASELVLHGKVYYVAPAYPALIAVGAVAVERLTRAWRARRVMLGAAIVFAGVAIMPLATPVLPLPALLAYQRAIDVRSVKMENHPSGRVPQQFADQLGWDELEATIARTVSALPPAERASAAILTGDYGQAAALDFLGRRDDLPPAISGHNEYYLWGPRGEHAVIVAVGLPEAVLAREYRSIVRVTTYTSPYVLPQNSDLPVYVCRRPRMPLVRFWPQLRAYV